MFRVFRRWAHSNADEHFLRKALVQANQKQYYPTLNAVRSQYSNYQLTRISQFISTFHKVDFDQYPKKLFPEVHMVEGRINSIRKSGKNMLFIDIVQDESKIQLIVHNKLMNLSSEEFAESHSGLRKGDYINCVGHPSVSNVGELLLRLSYPIKMLSPCVNSSLVPDKINDQSLINSHRVLNYLVDHNSRQTMMVKSAVIQSVRNFFLNQDFMEVSTPILGHGSGANANPFVTKSVTMDKPLELRVAPELWLKKLVIGGFDKIFEIGTNFRNEGIDATHNPEFTSCEFYQTYLNLDDLIDITQRFLQHVHGDVLQKFPNLESLGVIPSFTNFTRYEFIPTIEKLTGERLPEVLSSENLIAYHNKLAIPLPSIKSPASLLDNLSSIYIEPLSANNQPMFIYNQPEELSPLAKSTVKQYDGRDYNISLRFELFINGKEYVNAYEEENNPYEQEAKFKSQQQNKLDYNDKESLTPDWNYTNTMYYGLPPTGGWGCGIDRLVMLFARSERIDEVLPFGDLRDVLKQ